MLKLATIEARTLDEAWFKCLFELFDGDYHTYKIDSGSFTGDTRREFDWITIRIAQPAGHPEEDMSSLRRLIPSVPYGVPAPCDEFKVLDYFNEYLFSSKLRPDEQYTYGSRICGRPLVPPNDQGLRAEHIRNQVEEVIHRYRELGHGNNQLVLQIAQPDDLMLDDPPCLRHIDTRIRYGKLHFMPYFRSWDLWGGFPLNLAGLQLLKEYMASEIDVEDGEMLITSKGLHVYGHAEDVARMRAGKKGAANSEA
jgi:thymidylate synthase